MKRTAADLQLCGKHVGRPFMADWWVGRSRDVLGFSGATGTSGLQTVLPGYLSKVLINPSSEHNVTRDTYC